MTIQEAIQENKRFKRKHWTIFYDPETVSILGFTRDDLLADDWELEDENSKLDQGNEWWILFLKSSVPEVYFTERSAVDASVMRGGTIVHVYRTSRKGMPITRKTLLEALQRTFSDVREENDYFRSLCEELGL